MWWKNKKTRVQSTHLYENRTGGVLVVYAPGFSLHMVIVKMEVRGMPYAYWLPEPEIEQLKMGAKWLGRYIEIEALKAEQRGRDKRDARRYLASGGEDQGALREDG